MYKIPFCMFPVYRQKTLHLGDNTEERDLIEAGWKQFRMEVVTAVIGDISPRRLSLSSIVADLLFPHCRLRCMPAEKCWAAPTSLNTQRLWIGKKPLGCWHDRCHVAVGPHTEVTQSAQPWGKKNSSSFPPWMKIWIGYTLMESVWRQSQQDLKN